MIRIQDGAGLAVHAPAEASRKNEVAGGPADVGATSFADVLVRTVEDASALQKEADVKAASVAEGVSDDLHGTMIAMKEAEISMKLVASVRTKLMDAFHELWRTSV
ncbi:MAG: flagellar hook-basal body complex protein FliE [Polyangiaceae bacterium]